MPRTRPTATALTAAALSALLLSSCGASVRPQAEAPQAQGYPVTVTNCGQELTFDRAPERVVAYDSGIVETVFALGLTDRLAGYVMSGSKNNDIEGSPWKAEYERAPRLGVDRISKESILEAGADFVYAGWNYGFSEDRGLTPAHLDELGVRSYVLSESCRNGVGTTSRGTMAPLEALYTDLRNLGKIFGVPERAERLVAEYQEVVRQAEATVPADRPRPKVFLYDSGADKPFTGGKYAASNEIITRGGGDDVMSGVLDSWTTVTWESVVEANPDVIVINDYDVPSAEDKRKFLETYPPLAQVPAVRNGRFLVLPYAALVQGPRNPAAIRTVADYLNGL
ncbi:ABC transporter substrate-binding protein [Actinosynnema sp.]|uniref:ABC transporter substrate-binding protein n=1 Tax=Actinosynnema sp. TaxID=1872144 RepID=UPI003F861808